jgi:hypothetical protein
LNTSSESEELLYLRFGLEAAALGFLTGFGTGESPSSSLILVTVFFLAGAFLAGALFAGGFLAKGPSSVAPLVLAVPLFFLAGAFLAAFLGDSFFFVGTNSSSDEALKIK